MSICNEDNWLEMPCRVESAHGRSKVNLGGRKCSKDMTLLFAFNSLLPCDWAKKQKNLPRNTWYSCYWWLFYWLVGNGGGCCFSGTPQKSTNLPNWTGGETRPGVRLAIEVKHLIGALGGPHERARAEEDLEFCQKWPKLTIGREKLTKDE